MTLSVYRIAQESLQNVRKHSRARTVGLALTEGPDTLRLTIRDDGVGFDPERAAREGGLGLLSMGERCQLLRGTLCLSSSPGMGSEVVVSVPHPAGP